MTSLDTALLEAVVVATPASVLRLLAATGEAAPGEGVPALPAVTVYLAGGQVLDGELVKVGTDHGHEVAILAIGQHLAYVQVPDVRAVTVAAPDSFRDVLTGGALPLPVTGPPVTRLGLRRDFAPSPDFPLHVDWDALPDSPEALANLARLLDGLRTTVEEVRGDEPGRRAWAAVRALHVEHLAGAPLSVRAAPDGLAAQADLTAALPRDLAGELRRQVSSVL
jgi:hypothetical protein